MTHNTLPFSPAVIAQFFFYSDSLGLARSPQLSHAPAQTTSS